MSTPPAGILFCQPEAPSPRGPMIRMFWAIPHPLACVPGGTFRDRPRSVARAARSTQCPRYRSATCHRPAQRHRDLLHERHRGLDPPRRRARLRLPAPAGRALRRPRPGDRGPRRHGGREQRGRLDLRGFRSRRVRRSRQPWRASGAGRQHLAGRRHGPRADGHPRGRGRVGGRDYTGIDVHRAARIMAAGHGGQVLRVGGRPRCWPARIADSAITFRDLGTHSLRDLPAPDAVFGLVAPGLRTDSRRSARRPPTRRRTCRRR